MAVNPFIWENYKESRDGQRAVELFDKLHPDIFVRYVHDYFLDVETICSVVVELLENSDIGLDEEDDSFDAAERIFQQLLTEGIAFFDDEGKEYDFVEPDFAWYLDYIVPISTFLYCLCPQYFKPFFFIHNFRLFVQIADAFGMELPPIPLKHDKQARFEYYWQVCQVLHRFERENQFTPAEMCAFLYDFCPNYLQETQAAPALPQPNQIWLVGANKQGGDFEFVDACEKQDKPHFWQGNLDTQRGDIIIMYCLAPRSYIHSVWRAESDGIAAPFFHWYSSITIGRGQKIKPITLKRLKNHPYFSQHKLVKKNFQGVNGYGFSVEDWRQLRQMIAEDGGDVTLLPDVYAPEYVSDRDIANEQDVEWFLIEPLLLDNLAIDKDAWIRQLVVKMGRGEKVFPDYALLSCRERGYEQASVLIEAKFHIKNNRELEQAFRQVWSYGLRLSATLLLIADKNAVWLYERGEQGFDRGKYLKFFWAELNQFDHFQNLKKIFAKHYG